MKYLGVAGLQLHDAGMTLIDDKGNIEFASLAERYTGIKHHSIIPHQMWERAYYPYMDCTQIVINDDWEQRSRYRSDSLVETARSAHPHSFDKNESKMHRKHPSVFEEQHGAIAKEHHAAHAAAALMTRPKDWAREDCVCVTIDGVGEYRTAAIYDHNLELVWEMNFPKSIGYLYAHFTDECGLGLKSNNDEYVIMGLSCYSEPTHWEGLYELFNECEEWSMDYVEKRREKEPGFDIFTGKIDYVANMLRYLKDNCKSLEDASASLQRMTEEAILDVMREARKYGKKLCYSGGVAQNIMANGRVAELFDDMWVDLNPGDGGASLGAAGLQLFHDTGIDRLNWEHPYLGYSIEGDLDPEKVVDHLLKYRVCGVANGPAEFSYRAYGNRSLIADVRYDVKDTVNTIKRRQKFRPFAPAILEEHAHEYFSGPMNQWMQYCAKAEHPYSSVTHVDGTGRVQLVPKDCKSVFRQIIECYYARTGIPMLLNTSLNIRGKPMVNTVQDAYEFEEEYGVKVFTS